MFLSHKKPRNGKQQWNLREIRKKNNKQILEREELQQCFQQNLRQRALRNYKILSTCPSCKVSRILWHCLVQKEMLLVVFSVKIQYRAVWKLLKKKRTNQIEMNLVLNHQDKVTVKEKEVKQFIQRKNPKKRVRKK